MKISKRNGSALLVAATAIAVFVGCNDQPSNKGAGSGTRQATANAPSESAKSPNNTSTPTVDLPSKPSVPDVKPAAGTASLVGKVIFNGEPPKRRPINFGPEKKCHEHHDSPPLDDTLVVNASKGIQWVLVRISSKVDGKFDPPSKPAVLDQKGCVFLPHSLPVMVGQEVEIRNSDPVLHNVRCEAVINPSFNRNLPKPGDSFKLKFDTPEVGMKLKCDVHFWMGGQIHVLAHPFFALTGEDGSFNIGKVPPGTYKIEAWHEKLGKLVQDVTVKEGDVKSLEFVFQPK